MAKFKLNLSQLVWSYSYVIVPEFNKITIAGTVRHNGARVWCPGDGRWASA